MKLQPDGKRFSNVLEMQQNLQQVLLDDGDDVTYWNNGSFPAAVTRGCLTLLLRTTMLMAVIIAIVTKWWAEFLMSVKFSILCWTSPKVVALRHAAVKPVR